MAAYNLFLKEVTLNEWTAEGGTALEAIGKSTVDPANPATAPNQLKSAQAGRGARANLTLPEALIADLAAGGMVVAATVHANVKQNAAAGKAIRFGFVTPAVYAEPEVSLAQAWYTVSLSKAQAEALTQKALEELVLVLEHLTVKATFAYELYLSLETEAASGVTIPLNSAASISAASMAVTAATGIPLGAAASVSAASMFVTAPTAVPLAPATSVSAASLSASAPTQIPLQSASSTSGAGLGLTAATTIALGAAQSTSNASASLTAPTQIPLSPGASTSNASCTVSIGTSAAVIALQPATSTSNASLSLTAATQIPLSPAATSTDASLAITAKTTIALQPALSISSASATVTAAGASYPVTITLTDRARLTLTLTGRRRTTLLLTDRARLDINLEAR